LDGNQYLRLGRQSFRDAGSHSVEGDGLLAKRTPIIGQMPFRNDQEGHKFLATLVLFLQPASENCALLSGPRKAGLKLRQGLAKSNEFLVKGRSI
jgi:hypothetical protein